MATRISIDVDLTIVDENEDLFPGVVGQSGLLRVCVNALRWQAFRRFPFDPMGVFN
jgi:hypothetical protein